MTVCELHKLLRNMLKAHPECEVLPVRLNQDLSCYGSDVNNANFWLTDFELHSTGQSGYEVCGELTLIGEE